MTENRIITRIINRNDTAQNWLLYNPILLRGEIGIENDTGKFKVGNGVDTWSNLKYASSGELSLANGALLSTITEEKVSKWDKAEENTLEKIFVNGSEVSIISKSVDIQVPTKASDIGAAEVFHTHDNYILLSEKGVANGIATLDEFGKVPAAQLPSYVDDVVEVENFDSLPATGAVGKIYVTIDTNKTYRWSGTQYTPIGSDLALGETALTAFRGDYGKLAYEHAVLTEHAPTTPATIEKLGLVKSATGANYVNVAEDGTMKVGVVSTSSLRVPIGEELILDGGSSDRTAPYYPTRIGNIGYRSVQEAVNFAGNGDVVTLQDDLALGTQDNNNLVISAPNVTLDLAGKSLTASGENGAINVTGGTTTLSGEGIVEGTLGSANYSMAVWAKNGKVIINGGTYRNATDGSTRGTDLIYASANGQVEINGGIFEAAKPEWTLNCNDKDYKAGTAKIVVKGGKFKNFDPSNNNTEGVGTNYVAPGYKVVREGEYYIVQKSN